MKRMLAAVGSNTGTKIVYTDQPNGGEPLDAVCKALADIGVQPETVEALAERTVIAASKRRTQVLKAIERLRAVPGMTDDLALDILHGDAIVFEGDQGTSLVVTKAKHDARHPETGRFTPAGSGEAHVRGWRLGGATHPALLRMARAAGKREPGDDGAPAASAYGPSDTRSPSNPGGPS